MKRATHSRSPQDRDPRKRSGPRSGAGPGPRGRSAGPARPANARDIVHRRLAAQTRKFPELDLAPLDTEGLDARDAAFAHAIIDIVNRRWLTLSFILEDALRRELREVEHKVQGALLAGAAQLLFMDRVPPHAAIYESVEWVKKSVRPGAGAIVNAALRKITEMQAFESVAPTTDAQFEGGAGEMVAPPAASGPPRMARREKWTDRRDEVPMPDGTAIVLARDYLPQDPMQRLAVATSNPIDLLRLLSRSMPMREVKRLALHGLAQPPVILNTAHARQALPNVVDAPSAGAPDFEPGESLTDLRLSAHQAPGHHVFRGSHAALTALLHQRRDIWAQDPASSLAVMSVADLKPDLVIDVCAGMGTKTRQLALSFPNAKIVATDIDSARHRVLSDVFAGDPQVQVVAHRDLDAWAGRADLVLIDAPCSNTGVLARRVEARYRASEEKTRELTAVQRQIVADSVRLLSDGKQRGRIVYSTCSLDPRENQEIGQWASRWHALSPARENTRLPSGGPGEADEAYSDGSYAALLG